MAVSGEGEYGGDFLSAREELGRGDIFNGMGPSSFVPPPPESNDENVLKEEEEFQETVSGLAYLNLSDTLFYLEKLLKFKYGITHVVFVFHSS